MTAGLETFAKVKALHDRAATPGEKAAAAGRMEALARNAGMTVAEAVSKLDGDAAAPQPRSFFDDLFNSPAFRAEREERDRERASRRAELLKVYGSEAAVFADTPREAAMRAACAPLVTRRRITGGEMDTLDGWSGVFSGRAEMPASVREAVCGAWPFPQTVAEAWAEFDAAEHLDKDRCAFAYDYSPEHWIEARRYVLEELLNTMPARSLNDIRARLSWMDHLNALEVAQDPSEERVRLATLRADIERMGARIRDQDGSPTSPVEVSRPPDPAPSPVQSGQDQGAAPCAHPCRPDRVQGHAQSAYPSGPEEGASRPAYPSRRTNAEKRRAVLDLLRVDAGISGIQPLSDREIARRAGVAPSTVANTRRAQA